MYVCMYVDMSIYIYIYICICICTCTYSYVDSDIRYPSRNPYGTLIEPLQEPPRRNPWLTWTPTVSR